MRWGGGQRRGFSLVEFLVVVAIIAILAGLGSVAVSGILQSTQLKQAGGQVQQYLVTARNLAQTRNRRVEVRFYSFLRAEDPQPGPVFHAMQMFVVNENMSRTPIDKISRLPGLVIFNESAELSRVLSQLPAKTWSAADPQIPLPGVGTAYSAKGFEFRPDGRTVTTSQLTTTAEWTLTLHQSRHGRTTSLPPANFITFQLDPVNGTLRTFQP